MGGRGSLGGAQRKQTSVQSPPPQLTAGAASRPSLAPGMPPAPHAGRCQCWISPSCCSPQGRAGLGAAGGLGDTGTGCAALAGSRVRPPCGLGGGGSCGVQGGPPAPHPCGCRGAQPCLSLERGKGVQGCHGALAHHQLWGGRGGRGDLWLPHGGHWGMHGEDRLSGGGSTFTGGLGDAWGGSGV